MGRITQFSRPRGRGGSVLLAELLGRFAAVPAAAWQCERAALRATQERQTKMRRFRLHRAAYLADLEARWAQISETGPP